MSQNLCRRLIETALGAWAVSQSLDVEWENVPFEPVTGQTYLRAFQLPANSTSPDLAGAITTYRGIYQIDIVAPINEGAGPAGAIADELAQLFKLNTRYTAPPLALQIVSPCTVAKGAQDASDYIVPVSFQYRADSFV
ncbi:phage tail terminator-like protein [Dyella caseinilytica]|uniref:DUF4128 domain-containing protein n=1 Tax=Dyella caseinilytica TaxID=1849581 RepID=A0ABX7GRF0_9GAMM|nr:phage tail terminator-like protein [Dyella caseinilytica]QRN52392.1 DUF4128 domain-containing protein [Dyella caseinilytica]GGA05599.1 hypothetical protein GCM10011408_28150 [Dyella caseinilytica]